MTSRRVSAGFKAGQSRAGGLGYEREVTQTLNAHMSGTEPTMLTTNCLTPSHPQTHRVYGVSGAFPSVCSNSHGGQNQQSILINPIHDPMNTEADEKIPDELAPEIPNVTVHDALNETTSLAPAPSEEGQAALDRPTAEVRRLTPTECSRLMGFPESWLTTLGNEPNQYKGAGNSWAEPCARLVLKGIHRVDALLKKGEFK